MELKDVKLRKWQIVMIDEKNTHVRYAGCECKGPRPYLVLRADLYGQFFSAVPLTDTETKNRQTKKIQYYYLETNVMGDTSYAKMNFINTFHKDLIIKGIVKPIEKNLNKSQRSIAIKLAQKALED